MPLYNTSSTASAIGVTDKWLDNLLSHNKIEGVQQARQGVARRLSLEAVLIITVTRSLMEAFSIPAPRAIALANDLMTASTGSVVFPPAVSLVLDIPTLRAMVIDQLMHAIEITPTRPRGRPKTPPTNR